MSPEKLRDVHDLLINRCVPYGVVEWLDSIAALGDVGDNTASFARGRIAHEQP